MVGINFEDWEQRKLSDLMIFSNGINAPKENYGKGKKMISVMDILADEPLTYKKIRNSVEIDNEMEKNNKVEHGDLIFVRSSEVVSEVGLSKAYLEYKYALYSGFTIRGKKKVNYNPRFIELSLNVKNRKEIERKAGGSTRYNISQKILNEINIFTPDLNEENKIGDFITKLDDTIALHQDKLEKLKQLKKGYMQLLFPEKDEKIPSLRFANFSKDWEKRKLGDMLEERNEQIPEKEEYPLMSFVQGVGVTPKGDRYDRSFLVKDNNKKYKKTELRDFIYSSNNLETGSIGFNKIGKAVISPVYSIFSSKNKLESQFIGILSTRKDFINKMIHFRQGVVYGQWRIHEKDFLSIEIFVPSSEEQRKIISFFKQLDEIIALHHDTVEKLKQLKEIYLQKLFI